MSKNKLIKTGGIYLLSAIITNIINLLLLPIYINNLTTSEYGQYNIVITIQSLISILVSLSISSGMCRFFNEYKDKNRIKNITLTFSILWGSIILIVVFLFSPFIAKLIFNGDVNGSIYVNYIAINATLLSIILVYTSYYSMQYNAFKSSIISISNLILTLFLVIYFLLIKEQNIVGILKAQCISSAIITIMIIIDDLKNIKLIISKIELKEQISFGIGVMPGELSNWVLTLIDRYFIKNIVNLSAVGIYSLGYKIGTLIEPVFNIPFAKMFTAFKFEAYKQENGKEKIKNMFRYYNIIGWFCILGLSIFAEQAICILGTSEYSEAIKIVPIIAFSYYLWGLSDFYALGIVISNKMAIKSIAVTIGSVINIILNIVLIPFLDIYGAAISTVISYMIVNIICYYKGKQYYDLEIGIIETYKYSIPFIFIYLIYLIITLFNFNTVISIFLKMFLCFIYLLINIKMNFIHKDEINIFLEYIYLRVKKINFNVENKNL